MISIYTDGSSLNNGRKNSKGAYACVYPSMSAESFGRPLPADGSQTNQTAELTGILEGVRTLKTLSDVSGTVVRICTDSEYSINCLTKWIVGWRKRDWKTAEGKPVVHRVLLEAILKELEGLGGHQFVHVKAHTGGDDTDSKWNDYADQLANKSAELGRPVKFEELAEKVVRLGTSDDEVLGGIPLKIMGAPVSEGDLVKAILENTGSIDMKFLTSALITALKKTLQSKAYDLEKTKIHGKVAYRLIEKTHLTIEKLEE
jgi:ribonuclease HI